MIEKKEVWTVCWSETQQCFHVDWLSRTMQGNTEIFLNPNYCNDWSLLGVFDTQKECRYFIRELRKARGIERPCEVEE